MRDLTNQVFGRITALEPAGVRNGRVVWRCRCECGNEKEVSAKHLVSGGSTSCGCYGSQASRERRLASAQSFESRLKLNRKTGCLEWQGSRDRREYGTLRAGNKDHKAHRVAYEKAYGPIPSGRYVCHTCDNPPCCEPLHLFLGDARSNKWDSVNKGRHTFGDRQVAAKVNDHIVQRIRALADTGLSQQKIADLFGIHQANVSKIIRRAAWSHVK